MSALHEFLRMVCKRPIGFNGYRYYNHQFEHKTYENKHLKHLRRFIFDVFGQPEGSSPNVNGKIPLEKVATTSLIIPADGTTWTHPMGCRLTQCLIEARGDIPAIYTLTVNTVLFVAFALAFRVGLSTWA